MTTNTGREKELGTRILRQDTWDRKAWAGQPGECRNDTGRARKRGQGGQNMTKGQGS